LFVVYKTTTDFSTLLSIKLKIQFHIKSNYNCDLSLWQLATDNNMAWHFKN